LNEDAKNTIQNQFWTFDDEEMVETVMAAKCNRIILMVEDR
jgi:hypothetical protein